MLWENIFKCGLEVTVSISYTGSQTACHGNSKELKEKYIIIKVNSIEYVHYFDIIVLTLFFISLYFMKRLRKKNLILTKKKQ